MKANVIRNRGVWIAFFTDEHGRVGGDYMAATRDDALLRLGMEYGRAPQNFARELGQLMPAYERELAAQA